MANDLDPDGYLPMEAFSDDDLGPEEEAAVTAVFVDPPPLPDSDWLMLMATAVSAPSEEATVDDDDHGDASTTDDPYSGSAAHYEDLDRGGWVDDGADEWSAPVSHADPEVLHDDDGSVGT